MTLPRVLVVDDQYARDSAARLNFMEKTRLIEEGEDETEPDVESVGRAVFCSGQRRLANGIENDYKVIRKDVAQGNWALVLLDVRFDSGRVDAAGRVSGQPGDDDFGERVRQWLEADFPNLPVVMLSSKHHDEISDRATPYLSKRGLTERKMRKTLLLHGRLDPDQTRRLLGSNNVVARAPATIAAFREAFVHADSNVSALILGESGVGKEVLARYIHDVSSRSGGRFVAINVAAIPREMVESELFGVAKGAATGVGENPGKFELANGGTLFLDEIGDTPLDTQAKVLRALQEREIYRVGSREPTKLDIRLVCATSRDLSRMMEEGTFREDLYHRINTIPIRLPSLRDRNEDIAPLAQAFLAKAMSDTDSDKEGVKLSADALALLEQHSFPGNVRELENLVSRLVSGAGHHEVIGAAKVRKVLDVLTGPRPVGPPASGNAAPAPAQPTLTLVQLIAAIDRVVIDGMDPALAGIKPRLEKSFQALLQRLAGALLARWLDPVTGEFNRQQAMRVLTGDSALKGKGPGRVINEILGKSQEAKLEDTDIEALVELWKKSKKRD